MAGLFVLQLHLLLNALEICFRKDDEMLGHVFQLIATAYLSFWIKLLSVYGKFLKLYSTLVKGSFRILLRSAMTNTFSLEPYDLVSLS